MNFNAAGTSLIKNFESCKLASYPDPATGGDPWTIGWGCTRGVTPGMTINQEQADQLFIADIFRLSMAVRTAVHPTLNNNQFSAAICFAYNVKSWQKTPLFSYLKAGNFEKAVEHWMLYCKADGAVMAGLKRRREAELALFATTP